MRVVSGTYGGRTLKSPKHGGVRPTADRVKEALFNIIGPRIQGAVFLDLFAGTGGIGIEAISRGAASVVTVDENSASIKLVKENCRILNPEDQPRILHLSYDRALSLLGKELMEFDLIFLDPPFESGFLPEAIRLIDTYKLLGQAGLLIAEHPRNFLWGDFPLNIVDQRNYGDIGLTFFNYS